MSVIAGHVFDSLDVCSCGRKWLDIAHTTEDQIGESGIAHYGALNRVEYDSIEQRRRHEREHIWSMLIGVATGGGPVASGEIEGL